MNYCGIPGTQLAGFFHFYTEIIPSTLEEIATMTGMELSEIECLNDEYEGMNNKEKYLWGEGRQVPEALYPYVQFSNDSTLWMGGDFEYRINWQLLQRLGSMGYNISELFRSGDLDRMNEGLQLLQEGMQQTWQSDKQPKAG